MIISDYLNHLEAQGKSEQTIKQYRSAVTRFAAFLIGVPHHRGEGGVFSLRKGGEKYTQQILNSGEAAEALRSATILDAAKYKRYLESDTDLDGKPKKPLAPRSVLMNLTQLRVFYDWMKDRGHVLQNIFRETNTEVTIQQEAPKWLTDQQVNHLLRIVNASYPKNPAKRLRAQTIVVLLLNTGLRVSELCNLKLDDITIKHGEGSFRVRGKGNKVREVPLNERARTQLRQYLAEYPLKGRYLIDSERSEKATPRAIEKLIAKFAKEMDLEGELTPHTLRHTCLHWLVQAKVPLDVVAMFAGHMHKNGIPNTAMTQRYTLPNYEDMKRSVESISW